MTDKMSYSVEIVDALGPLYGSNQMDSAPFATELYRVYWMNRSEPTIMTKKALDDYIREHRHQTYIREYEVIGGTGR